jgi:large subunit ribosomal protein L4
MIQIRASSWAGRLVPTLVRKQGLSAATRGTGSLSSNTRQMKMFSTKPLITATIPSNLRFDPRSSFAPKTKETPAKTAKTVPRIKSRPESAAVAVDEDKLDQVSPDGYEEDLEDDDDDNDSYFGLDPQRERASYYAIPLPQRLHVDILTLFSPNQMTVGTIWLDESVFGIDEIRVDLLKRAVDYYRAKKRGRRKAVTKTISQVSGSGNKRRNQKGTGRARMGHSRPPHHRGGAKAHGPKNVTDYSHTKLNQKVRRAAVRNALSQKLLEGNLIVLNQLHELPSHKTADLLRYLQQLHIGGPDDCSALILDQHDTATGGDDKDNDGSKPKSSYNGVPFHLWVASRNLHKIAVGSSHVANVYNILKHEKLVLTLAALSQLESTLKCEVY